MAMGEFESGVRPRDLYLLARSPEGELRAVMRFIAHRGKLSLDTMRRVGETPNGLNEALVCRALELPGSAGCARSASITPGWVTSSAPARPEDRSAGG